MSVGGLKENMLQAHAKAPLLIEKAVFERS